MENFSPEVLNMVLVGILSFVLYFDAKFKSWVLLSFFCFLTAATILAGMNLAMSFLITMILSFVMLIVFLIELNHYKKQGIQIARYTHRKLILAALLSSIYILAKLFYFGSQSK